MKKILILSLSLFSNVLFATDLNFSNIRLTELATLAYKEIGKHDYIADDTFQNDKQLVSIYLTNRSNKTVMEEVTKLISISGYEVTLNGMIYHITKKQDPAKPFEDYHVYMPKYRKIADLELLLRQAFPQIKVGLNNRQFNNTADPGGQGGNMPQNSALQNSGTQNQLVNDFLIFQSTVGEYDRINRFLSLVDQPIDQIEIVSASYEISDQVDSSRALDIIADIFKNLSFSVLTGGSNNILKFTGGSLTTALKFMDQDTRFRSISKPHARLKSGATATFQNGQEVPTLGAITQQNGVTNQSIEYRQSGVLMNITATALKETIDLRVKQEYSSFIPTRNGINNSPTLNKRLIETELNLANGEIVVIGGLQDTVNSKTNQSALGMIPTERTRGTRQLQTFVFLQATKL